MSNNQLGIYKDMIHKLKDTVFTNKYFLDPVLAEDGIIYERYPLIQYLINNNNKSPTTNESIRIRIIPVKTIKSIVDLVMDHFPYLKSDRYKLPDNCNPKIPHRINPIWVNELISHNKFDLLEQFDRFELSLIDMSCISELISNNQLSLQKKIFNNANDICKLKDHNQKNILYYIAKYGSYDLNKYIIETFDDIDYNVSCDNSKWTYTHRLCYRELGKDLIIKLINKGINLNIKNDNDQSVLYYIIRYYSYNTFMVAINKVQYIMELQKIMIKDMINEYKDNLTHTQKSNLIREINDKPISIQ
jgi:hypothetical protein